MTALQQASDPAAVPALIVPPGSVLQAGSPAVWFVANNAIYQRCTVPLQATYRYVGINIGVSSGNVQAGVVKLSGADRRTWTRVMNTGIIAAPAAGYVKLDCGATVLTPGDYAVFFWADNTTITVPHMSLAAVAGTPLWWNDAPGAGGVGASGTASATWGQRMIAGLTLLGDI